MPIRPENMAKYPGGSIRSPEWLAIRERIRARAGNCCEECGVRNLAFGYRNSAGQFFDLGMDRAAAEAAYLDAVPETTPSQVGNLFRIVCTVAHVDGKLDDHTDANLRFWCQRDHNRHDAKSRQINASITRHEKVGQLDLIGRDH
jgi:hypothetical protein